MHPPTLPREDHIEGLIEDTTDAVSEGMPVDRPASFQGKLNLDQFVHPTSGIIDPPRGLNSSTRAVQAQAKVRGDSRPSEPRSESTSGYRTRSTTVRSIRSTPSTPNSTSSPSTDLTLPPSPRPPLTRSRTSFSSSPPARGIIRSRKARSRRTPLFPTEEESLLRDTIPENLILLLVGVNPGIMTGETGHAYAHPTNQFWKLLHASGITDKLHPPSDTYKLPELYNVGNTNIVGRPTRDASMLSRGEMNDGVPKLEHKVATQRPQAVCLVGKGIWEAVWRVRYERPIRKEEFHYGWQDSFRMGTRKGSDWEGARIFVATTTSGVSTNFSFEERTEIWKQLGEWVRRQREERKQNASDAPSE